MKARLLKKLRRRGRNQITIYSVTKNNGTITGMSIGYNEDAYSELWDFADTKEDVYKKAENIYLRDYINRNRTRI